MRFIDALCQHQLLRGMLVTTPSPEIAEAISFAELDWAFIDMEHAPIGILDAQNIVRAFGGRVASIIRVPDLSATHIKKALDTGCDGILAPQVNTRDEALAVVEAAKYAPHGHRSIGITRAHKYGTNFQNYIDTANKETAVIVQIESKTAVDNIDGILSVPGIDAIFIGAYDLSASMNVPGQLDNRDVQAAIDTIFTKAKKAKMPIGLFKPNVEAAKPAVERGATLLAVGIDTIHIAEAARKIMEIGR